MSLIIIAVTVLLSMYALNNYTFFEKALFRPYLMKTNNEWWRWISNGFIHKDYSHLIVNMLAFFFFSTYVEQAFSSISGTDNGILFVFFYLSAIAISGMYEYYRFQNTYSYSALGASGAVSAVIFSYIMFEPFNKIYLYFVVGIPAWIFGILYLFYEYYMGKKQNDNIGHHAHFFGAVYGLIFPILIHPQTGIDFVMKFVNLFQ